MKSFRSFLIENPIGPYPTTNFSNPGEKKVKLPHLSDTELYATLERHNVAPDPEAETVPLNDKYHARVLRQSNPQAMGNNPTSSAYVSIHPNDPQFSHIRLMSYSLSSVRDVFDHTGRRHAAFTGYPKKNLRAFEKTSDFKIPDNFIHAISNHLGAAVISDREQSMGGASFWRRAIKHGQNTGSHVRFMDPKAVEGTGVRHLFSGAKATIKNRKNAYTRRVSKKQTTDSKVDPVTRSERHLAVFPGTT